ncbi:MAG: hypothetical protein AAGE65_05890 [Planctomycetota bacterium]
MVFLQNTRIATGDPVESDKISLLEREVFRQAVARAIEEHAGWLVVDVNLHETAAGLDDLPSLQLRTRLARVLTDDEPTMIRYTWSIEKRNEGGQPWRRVAEWESEIKYSRLFLLSLADAVRKHEASEILPALTAANLAATNPINSESEGGIPEDIATLLSTNNVVAQWQAARKLTQLIHVNGVSAVRIAARARSYALLSELTRPYLSSVSQVYAARAILGADRAVHLAKDDLNTGLSQSYVLSLTGFHRTSGWIFSSLQRGLGFDLETIPPWSKATQALTLFRHERLSQLADAEGNKQAALLALIAQEDRPFEVERDEAAVRSLRHNPLSIRTLLCWWTDVGVGRGQQLIRLDVAVMAKLLEEQAAVVSGVPDEVAEALRRARSLPSQGVAIRALRNADDSSAHGDRLSALGFLLLDASVTLREREAEFVWSSLNADAGPIVDLVSEHFSEHPVAPMIRLYGYRPGDDRSTYVQLLDDYDFGDLPPSMRPLWEPWNLAGLYTHEAYQHQWLRLGQHVDSTAHGLADRVNNAFLGSNNPRRFNTAFNLLKYFSAAHPAGAIGYTAEAEIDGEGQVAYIERLGESMPEVAYQWAFRLRRAGRLEDARHWFEKAVAGTRDPWIRLDLSNLLWELGDDEANVRVLLKALELPDSGLAHSRVNHRLSRAYLRAGNLVQAVDVGEAAAESHAAWAMQTAAVAQEASGNLARAEHWLEITADRYDSLKLVPGVFALRTGRNLDPDRRQRTNAAVDALADSRLQENVFDAAAYRILTGDVSDALDILDREAPPNYLIELLRMYVAKQLDRSEVEVQAREALGPLLKKLDPTQPARRALLMALTEVEAPAQILFVRFADEIEDRRVTLGIAPREVSALGHLAQSLDHPNVGRRLLELAIRKAVWEEKRELNEPAIGWAWLTLVSQSVDPREILGWGSGIGATVPLP